MLLRSRALLLLCPKSYSPCSAYQCFKSKISMSHSSATGSSTRVIGLSGGIDSGKSTVARLLSESVCRVASRWVLRESNELSHVT